MRKQLTKQQRQEMGEIEDAAFAIAKTGRLMSRDFATFKFYDDLNKAFAFDTDDIEAIGRSNISPVVQEMLSKGDKLVKVQQGKLKDTVLNKWGNLEGRYLPKSIVDDLKQRETYETVWNGSLRGYKELNSWWKVSKTAWNPTVHMNNFMANMMMFDLADGNITKDLPYQNLMKAFDDLARGNAIVDEARSLGALSADLFSVELRKKTQDILKTYNKNLAGVEDPSKIMDVLSKTSKFLAGNSKGFLPADIYRLEDQVFRVALYRTRLEQGFSPEDAAREAKRWFIDYDINAPWVNHMRETATPFLAYTYRAIPLVAEAAVTRPWKMAKWAALGYSLNYLGDEGDTEKNKKLFPEYLQGKWFGVGFLPDRLLSIPLRDERGNNMYQDFTRWMPTGDALAQNKNALIPYLPAPLQPSFGLGGAIVSGLLGYDMFTQTELKGLGSGFTFEDLKIKIGFIAKNLLPNFPAIPVGDNVVIPVKIPFTDLESFSSQKVTRAVKQMNVGDPLRDELSVWGAIAQTVGIKIMPADIEKLSVRKSLEFAGLTGRLSAIREQVRPGVKLYDATIRGLDAELDSGDITEQEYDRKYQDAVIRLQRDMISHMRKVAKLNVEYARIFLSEEEAEEIRLDSLDLLEENKETLEDLKVERQGLAKGGEVTVQGGAKEEDDKKKKKKVHPELLRAIENLISSKKM